MAIPEWRCSKLYQGKKSWQKRRASWIEPKRSGKLGWYLSVLNWDSEYGLSSETCGRLCVLSTPRSTQRSATDFEVMAEPRSAWILSVPGATFSFAQVSAISCSASTADSASATIQPTT